MKPQLHDMKMFIFTTFDLASAPFVKTFVLLFQQTEVRSEQQQHGVLGPAGDPLVSQNMEVRGGQGGSLLHQAYTHLQVSPRWSTSNIFFVIVPMDVSLLSYLSQYAVY
jgi:hypothetical protein